MKRHVLFYMLLCLTPWSMSAQHPYWEVGTGPYGGEVNITFTNGNLAYAQYVPLNFYYRSTDFGEHWQQIEVPSADSSADTETIYIGKSGSFYALTYKTTGSSSLRKLYRSTDEGQHWQLLDDQRNIVNMFELPSATLICYAPGNIMYRSTDGTNWDSIGYQGFNLYSGSLSYSNGTTIFISNTQGYYIYSNDDGQTWTLGGNNDFYFSHFIMMPSGLIFRYKTEASSQNWMVYRSADLGQQWDAVEFELEDEELFQSLAELDNGRLLLTSTSHVYFSDDAGLTWNILTTGGERPDRIFTSAPLSNGDLVRTVKNSTFRSSDGGIHWRFSSYNIQAAEVRQLLLLSDSLQVAVTHNGLWKSADAGDTWALLLPDTSYLLAYPRHQLGAFNSDSFAVCFGEKVWRSTNGGQTFEEITPPGPTFYSNVFTDHNSRLYVSSSAGLMQSADFGLSWQNIFPLVGHSSVWQHPSGELFITTTPFATAIPQLSRSNDGGVTWQTVELTGVGENPSIAGFKINEAGTIYIHALQGTQSYLLRSDDLGETWVTKPILDEYIPGALVVNSLNHIFTTGGVQNIIASIDDGQSWYFLPPYSPVYNYAENLEMSPSGILYVVTNEGPIYRTSQSTEIGGYIRGQVFKDADADCSTPDAQAVLQSWVVEINGEHNFVARTGESGAYAAYIDSGAYQVQARVQQNLWWALCDSSQLVQVNQGQIVDSVNFIALAVSECPLISTDIAIPWLRRCFDNTVYVSYCNSGTETADSAWIDVELDPYMGFVASDQPHTPLGANTYRFFLGTVEWGDCDQFSFTVHVDCDSTVIGQTHCVIAHAFPDTLCSPVPGWSGASIEASALCEGDTVHLQLKNTGTTPSALLDYIIIEDDVVLMSGQKQYNIGSDMIDLQYPANGHTWRIESEQEPGHPFSNLALAFLEGCGGYESLGYINQFSVNGWAPSINQECVENTGSYDPNDKQGFPLGYGDEHRIRPGQALEYMIRFQNTGTDTAFTVQIRDTLSQWLDPATVRPGASSHAYTWNLSGAGVLTFRFDNIHLPDSNTNLVGSQGFVNFRIEQRPGVPLETQILNSAAIYFDFNEPVITNQTLHTVGIDYITAAHDARPFNPLQIGIQPNPALHETLLSLPEGTERLTLFSTLGHPLRTWRVSGSTFRMERTGLPAGVYAVRAEDGKGKVRGMGKVVWR